MDAGQFKVTPRLVNSPATLMRFVEALREARDFIFLVDASADGKARAVHFLSGPHAFTVSLEPCELHDGLRREFVTLRLRSILESAAHHKVTHDLKSALRSLSPWRVLIPGPCLDVMLGAQLLTPDEDSPSLQSQAPGDRLAEIAAWEKRIRSELSSSRMREVLFDIEMPLVPVLSDMEERGIFLEDWSFAELGREVEDELARLEAEIYRMAGRRLDLASPAQIGHLCFGQLKIHESLGLPAPRDTRADTLRRYQADPLVRSVLAHRSAAKLASSYTRALPRLINPKTGRLHTRFTQLGAATGRLSSSQPNLQNIPARSSFGREMRRSIRVMRDDHVLIAADYSQIELRVLALLAGEQSLIAAFDKGEDVHALTASRLFNVPRHRVTPHLRDRAKTLNFGILYGMSPFRLSQETGLSMRSAARFIERFFQAYPKIRAYLDRCIEEASERGYSESWFGRRRPLGTPGKALKTDGRRMAINSPVQGTAADLVKIAMTKTSRRLAASGFETKLLLQVHDELVFEGPETEMLEATRLVQEEMETVLEPAFGRQGRLDVEIGAGRNWLESHFI